MAPLLKVVNQFSAALTRFSAGRSAEDAWFSASARDYLVNLIYASPDRGFEALLRGDQLSGLSKLLADYQIVPLIHSLPPPALSAAIENWLDSPGVSRRKLVAAMLAREPYRFPALISHLGDVLLLDEIKTYIGYCPKMFLRDIDRDKYSVYLTVMCNYFADRLEADPVNLDEEFLASSFLSALKVGAAYSAEGSLLDLAKAKARLIESHVRLIYSPEVVDWRPDAKRRPGPHRVGLLWYDLDRRTENIVGVASCRDFRKHGWEVISVVLNQKFSGLFGVTLEPEVKALSDSVLNLSEFSLHSTVRARPPPDHPEAVAAAVEMAAQIRALDLDLLLIMNNVTWGFSEHIALSCLRLARAQGVNFCAVVSTGLSHMDYWFSGELSERAPDPQAGYSERLIQLPGTCLVFDKTDYPEIMPLGAGRRDLDLAPDKFMFVSGANFYKLHPVLTKTWIRLLAETPDSVLVLYPLNPNWDTAYPLSLMRLRMTEEMRAEGLTGRRVIIAGPWKSAASATTLLTSADAYLDSFPHSGGLSSLDALSRGIPVVTLRGATQRENQTSDMLTECKMDRLIAGDIDAYVRIAKRLYNDPAWMARVRLDLTESFSRSSIFDTAAYARKFSEAIAGLKEMQEVN